MKRGYVRAVHVTRRGLKRSGMLRVLDRWAARSRFALWMRSLFAIYDVEDLLSLDIPWWTLKSATLVDDYLSQHPQSRVFEWGSGASTLWLGRRAAHVISVEHDHDWADKIHTRVPDNCQLLTVDVPAALSDSAISSRKAGYQGLDFTQYVSAIDRYDGVFDVIVIDGRAREACLERAVKKLAPCGLIVFDNVDRSRYVEAITSARVPLSVRWTRGLTPCLPYPTRTAIISIASR